MSKIQRISDRDVVKAFVSHLAVSRKKGLQIDRIPEDDPACADPPIDAIAGRFAIEHTSIDTIEHQRRDSSSFMKVIDGLEARFRGKLPYRLQITFPYEAVEKGQNWKGINGALATWIANESPALSESRHPVTAVPGVPFEFSVVKRSGMPGAFFSRSWPSDGTLSTRLKDQLDRKAAKLAPYQPKGFKTLLLVESDDIALMNEWALLEAIHKAYGGSLPMGVQEVWYADTGIPANLEFHDFTAKLEAENLGEDDD